MFPLLRRRLSRCHNSVVLPHARRDRREYNPAEMGRLLERERDRTDRTGIPFAMIVFHAEDAQTRRDLHAALVRVLAERLRISDEFGYLGRCHLGAVLPATSAAHAWTVADDICLKLPPDLPLPQCDVFAYPDEQVRRPSDSNRTEAGISPKSGANGDGAGGNGEGGNGLSANGDREVCPRVDRQLQQQTTLFQAVDTRPIHSLEPLYIRPLPLGKRVVDIVVASIALIALSPVLVLLSLAVKLTSRGPMPPSTRLSTSSWNSARPAGAAASTPSAMTS